MRLPRDMRAAVRVTAALAAALALQLPASARAEPPEPALLGAPGGAVAVDFLAEPGEPTWLAEALELEVALALDRFRLVTRIDAGEENVPKERCPTRAAPCLLEAYLERDVAIAVLGTLAEGELDYDVWDTGRGTRIAGGTLSVAEASAGAALSPQIALLIRPIVRSGGALEEPRRPRIDDAVSDRSPTTAKVAPSPKIDPELAVPEATIPARRAPETPASRLASLQIPAEVWTQVALLALALLLLVPMVSVRWLLSSDALSRAARPRSWRPTSVLVFLALAAMVVWATPPARAFVQAQWATLPAAPMRLVFPWLGGIAWACLALLTLRLILPKVFGLEQARHDALAPLLAAWLGSFVQRVACAALAVPPILAAVWVAERAGVPTETAWQLVAPLTGLALVFWWLSWVDNLTVVLDHLHVYGDATPKNPWVRPINRYLNGYIRRLGIDLDKAALDRVLLLPGKTDGIQCYGGGFARPRIVVGVELRELALGELPDESEAPDRVVDFDALPVGTVLPQATLADGTTHRTSPRRLRNLRRTWAAASARPKLGGPRLLGENTTLLGWVVPQAAEASVPLIANSEEDFGVVRDLLTEHYAAFDRKLREEEHDDTDPTQKDFLFGALLRELGVIFRGDSLVRTLLNYAAADLARASRPVRALGGAVREGWMALLSRYPAILADSFAALHHGRDALLQHLYYLHSGQEYLLTARADVPLLLRTSRIIVNDVAADAPQGKDLQIFRATVRNRIVWLSRFFHVQISEPRERRLWRLVVTGGVIIVLALIAAQVIDALAYHPTWLERRQLADASVPRDVPSDPNTGDAPHGGQH